jgi:NAD(P)-dependent dehydrogenase (short-subunit alcohol dehydrogenase family)
VTGAAGSIGRAAALAFAREGANVVAADLSEQGIQETARMIEEAGAARSDTIAEHNIRLAAPLHRKLTVRFRPIVAGGVAE